MSFILAWISRYALVGCAAVCAALLTAVGVQTLRLHHAQAATAEVQAAWQKSIADATVKARQTEENWQTNVDALTEVHQDEIAHVALARDNALRLLRNRASSRLPDAAQSACAGASPAALAAADAGVAIGFAAEFDQLRADYAICKGYVETVEVKQ